MPVDKAATPPAHQAPFDRRLLRARRDRAATDFASHNFLLREVASRMTERLCDINRSYPLALDLGCHGGEFAQALNQQHGHGVELLIHADPSAAIVSNANAAPNTMPIVADEETLPFAPQSLDLIVSVLNLHWVNDLPGALVQIRRALKPGGLFLGAMFGGQSLTELRQAFSEAELELEGGVSPRVSPFADVRDAGALLQRAGFAMPVADVDQIDVTYADPLALMRELRGMGESNALHLRRRGFLQRTTLHRACQIYEQKFGLPNGRIPVTVQVIYLTGWAPETKPQSALPIF